MFFYDKYRPYELKKNDFHPKIADKLIKLTQDDDLPNLLLYGLPGSGKKTLIHSLLYQVHGEEVLNCTEREIKIKPKDCTTFSIDIMESSYHIEIDPTQKYKKDRQIIQYLIKDYATTRNIHTYHGKTRYKIIVILNADELSHDAQAALRVTMEKYTKSCTIILCSSQLTKIIKPIRSRCFLVRVPLPTPIKLKNVIINVFDKENIDIKESEVEDAIIKSKQNLQKSFVLLQCQSSYVEESWIRLLKKDVVDVIFNISKNNKISSTAHFTKIRDAFYKILSHNIPGKLIMKKILNYILNEKLDDDKKIKIIKMTADTEFYLSNSSKDLIHLEYFVSQTINYLLKFNSNNIAK